MVENVQRKLKNDYCFENFVCGFNMADKIQLFLKI